uniref:Coenzyme Q-binding protein COQ10 START domain-containing protein n=1 Tax=Salix viminalis TaxID=40686 RepID=A0A6N2LBI2_SALVM
MLGCFVSKRKNARLRNPNRLQLLLLLSLSLVAPTLYDDYHDNDTDDDDGGYYSYVGEEEVSEDSVSEDGVFIEIKKLQKNSRRIRSKISINASLDTVWKILIDYEKLADFIPSLAASKLIDKKDNFARLYQTGQQNLAFGLKFNAKAILDCYERDLQSFTSGKKRDIEFKMTEGDFQCFEGKWCIEQFTKPKTEDSLGQEFETTLSYLVDVRPKVWLPAHLIEGRICKEIKSNLTCIREEAQKVIGDALQDQ